MYKVERVGSRVKGEKWDWWSFVVHLFGWIPSMSSSIHVAKTEAQWWENIISDAFKSIWTTSTFIQSKKLNYIKSLALCFRAKVNLSNCTLCFYVAGAPFLKSSQDISLFLKFGHISVEFNIEFFFATKLCRCHAKILCHHRWTGGVEWGGTPPCQY